MLTSEESRMTTKDKLVVCAWAANFRKYPQCFGRTMLSQSGTKLALCQVRVVNFSLSLGRGSEGGRASSR